MREITQARAAEFLVCRYAQQAQFSHFRPEVPGKLVLLVDLCRNRLQVVRDPAGDDVTNFFYFGIQPEVHR